PATLGAGRSRRERRIGAPRRGAADIGGAGIAVRAAAVVGRVRAAAAGDARVDGAGDAIVAVAHRGSAVSADAGGHLAWVARRRDGRPRHRQGSGSPVSGVRRLPATSSIRRIALFPSCSPPPAVAAAGRRLSVTDRVADPLETAGEQVTTATSVVLVDTRRP